MSVSSNHFKQIILSSDVTTIQTTISMLLGSIQDKESERNIVLAVNSLLSDNKTRSKGLELLNTLMVHCSADVLLENASFWTSSCIVNHKGQDPIKEIKLKTMEKIINCMGSSESFNKKFIQEYLTETVKACLTFQSNKGKVTGLKCLSQCMDKYPSSLNNFREKIESFVITFLEVTSKSEAREAAIAFHLLNQTGSAGPNGINYINNFRNNFKKLCATVHNLYDTLFEIENINDISDFEKIDSEVFKFTVSQPILDSEKYFEIKASRIINCLTFIRTMVMKRFPVEKQIVPKYVVDVIIRGLSVHFCLTEQNILMSRQVTLLKEIQLELLKLLRIFVIGHHPSILPFSNLLIKCVLNSAKRTNSCSCFSNDSSYKVAAYKTLISLMSKVNDQSQLQEALIPLLLEDIRPSKRKILLNQNFKKQDSTLAHLDSFSNKSCGVKSNSVKEDICAVALDVLKCFLTECPTSVNQPPLQEVMSSIIRTLTGVQINKVDPPYTSVICQIKLYEVLTSFFKRECKIIELPIHLVINLLLKGTESPIYQVAQTSREGLELIEKISHPLCSSLCINDSKSLSRHTFNKENLDEKTEGVIKPTDNREINILSNILIVEPIVENNGEVEVESVSKETIDQTNSDVVVETEDINDGIAVEGGLSNVKEDVDIHVNISSDEEEIKECSNEPPKKKQKQDEDKVLEDMFESFQNVVQ